MNEIEKLPFEIKWAALQFQRSRADYYEYLATILKSAGGGIKMGELFENDAQRYEKKARGILSAYWFDQYSNNGSNLAQTFEGTLPSDEVSIIRVSQASGDDALLTALADLARVAKLSDEVRSQSLITLLAGIIAVLIATVMLTAFPIFGVDMLMKSYDMLPLEAWPDTGKDFYGYAKWIEGNYIYLLLIAVSIGVAIKWTISNLIGETRDWLDQHIVLYKVIRDLKGALFLSTMSVLTRKRAGVMFTLKQSLEMFLEHAGSNWMRWRIEQILEGTENSGAIGVGAFKTGLINDEMFFYLEDMERSKGFADGFQETGKYVESYMLKSIVKKMNIYRWVMLMSSLIVVLFMMSWQFAVIYGMRGAMSNFMSNGL
jgi:type II secretory pathway component PulF